MNKLNFALVLILVLMSVSLACGATVALPTPEARTPAPKSAPVPATPHMMTVCLTAETVRVREGAGTSFAEVGILLSGDKVTVYGVPTISEDMGVWRNVNTGTLIGWTNARYLCEAK